ncbi:MAG: beta-galactosidase [Puniceicoccaceae bacterium]
MKSIGIFGLMLAFIAPACLRGNAERFFAVPGTEFGVYYYPEHWPEEQWERDLQQVKDLGFEFVHFAEFAWERLEPAECEYDFKWLDRVVDYSASLGLKVIMCTPSPCIPAWLSEKYPEILAMDETGRRVHHQGARLTASLASPVYQKYVARIVEQLALRYGQNKNVWGWQIGNEPHIQTVYDYSPAAESSFKEWLKKKYASLDELNLAWGGPFWSFSLSDFDQVNIPTPTLPQPNIHALLDFQIYTSEEIAWDLINQSRILRKYIRKDQWITTNYAYFKFLPMVDPFLTKDDLDFASHTMYLTSNWLNSSGDSLSHRLGSGLELSFSKELAASTNGYTGIMELQPGQINWGRFNAMPLPGAVRMWVWHAFALGDEFVCTYRYRQPLFGGEQFHHGIVMTDGVTVNRGGKEFIQAMDEIRELTPLLDKNKQNSFIEKSRTAFLWSNQSILDMENYKHHEDWDSWQHIYTYYQALKRLGVEVHFFEETADIVPEEYPFMIVAAHQLMSRQLIRKLEAYVDNGGHLILSTRTGLKNDRGHLWEMKLQEPIWALIGGEIEFYDHLPSAHPGTVILDNESYKWHIWAAVINPAEDTEVWAKYVDQFFQGKAAVTHRGSGLGSTTFVGPWSDGWELENKVVNQVYGRSLGSLPFQLPPYVFAHYRDGLWIVVNYTDKAVVVPMPDEKKILIGKRELIPGGILVWAD